MFRLIRTIKAVAQDKRVPRVVRVLLVVASFGWLIPGPLDEIIGALALLALLLIRPGLVQAHWRDAYRAPRLSERDRALTAVAMLPLVALAACALALVFVPSASGSVAYAPHAPALASADRAPSHLVYLTAHGRVTLADAYGHTCYGQRAAHVARGGYYTDVGAYLWNGSQLGAERWSARLLAYIWHTADGGYVSWDGATFRNHSHESVLVAGWCGAGMRGVLLED